MKYHEYKKCYILILHYLIKKNHNLTFNTNILKNAIFIYNNLYMRKVNYNQYNESFKRKILEKKFFKLL